MIKKMYHLAKFEEEKDKFDYRRYMILKYNNVEDVEIIDYYKNKREKFINKIREEGIRKYKK
jgi:hypothetical protein